MRRFVLVILSLVSCRLDEKIAIVLPDLEDARSMIVSLERDRSLFVYAQNLSAGGRVELPVAMEPGASGRIDVMTYQSELDVLRIRDGRLIHSDSGPRGPLPVAFRHYVVNVEEGLAGPVDTGAMSDALAMFRIEGQEEPPTSRCLTLSSEPVNLEGERWELGFSGFEIAVSSSVVLVGTTNHEIFRVTSDVERLVIEPAAPSITAGSIDEAGQLWFADTDGSLWRGELGTKLRLQLVATSTLGPIDVLSATEENAFAIVLPEAALVRFEAGRWRRLYGFCSTPDCGWSHRLALARTGPDEVVALEIRANDQNRNLVQYRGGAINQIPIPSEGFAYSVEKVEGFGTLIGVDDAILAFDGVDRFDPLVALPIFEVRAIARFREGLIIGGKAGLITQLVPGSAACDTAAIASYDVTGLVPLGEGMIAISEPSDSARVVPITIIRGD